MLIATLTTFACAALFFHFLAYREKLSQRNWALIKYFCSVLGGVSLLSAIHTSDRVLLSERITYQADQIRQAEIRVGEALLIELAFLREKPKTSRVEREWFEKAIIAKQKGLDSEEWKKTWLAFPKSAKENPLLVLSWSHLEGRLSERAGSIAEKEEAEKRLNAPWVKELMAILPLLLAFTFAGLLAANYADWLAKRN